MNNDPLKYASLSKAKFKRLPNGKEEEAWNCFEEYDLSDKEEVRAEIKKYLAKDTFYQHIRTLKMIDNSSHKGPFLRLILLSIMSLSINLLTFYGHEHQSGYHIQNK